MGRLVTFLFGLFAAAVFAGSLTVHVLALIPGTVLPFGRVVWLHALAMLSFFLMVAHGAAVHNRAVRLGYRTADVQPLMEGRVPCAVWAVGGFLFVYAILNFVHFAATVEGSASIRDDKYVLMKKSTFIREITEAEYHEHRRRDIRGMSGHWMIFSWVATVYFLVVAPRVRDELDAAPPRIGDDGAVPGGDR